MRRFLALTFLAATVGLFGLGPSTPAAAAAQCVAVPGPHVTFTHTDTKLTVRIDGPEGAQTCVQHSLTVYEYPAGVPLGTPFEQTFPQHLDVVSAPSVGLVYFEIPIPSCKVLQADVATGDAQPTIDATHQYGDRLVGSDTFQTGGCPPPPTTTTVVPTTSSSTPSTTADTKPAPTSTIAATSTTVCEKGKTCELAATGTSLWPLLATAGVLAIAGYGFAAAADRRKRAQ